MVLTAAPIGKNFQIAKVNGKDEIALDKSLSNRIHVK